MRSGWLWGIMAAGLGMVGAAACGGGVPNPGTTSGAGGGSTSSGGGQGGEACASEQEDCGNGVDDNCNGLVDEGEACVLLEGEPGSLVARYHVDEAESGTAPASLVDAAPEPLLLGLEYGSMMAEMAFATDGTSRALEWPSGGTGGLAGAPIDGSKIQAMLEGKTAATLEVVADVDGVAGGGSAVAWIGEPGGSGLLSLRTTTTGRMGLYLANAAVGDWFLGFGAEERTVIHAVLDLAQPDDAQRVRPYVNGKPVNNQAQGVLQGGEVISLGAGASLVLGNALAQDGTASRSFSGRLYYAALYAGALTEAQIKNNAATLMVRDDTPAPE